MFQAEVLKKIAQNSDIREDEPMSKHTTFRIGGPADIFISTNYTEDFINIIKYLQKENCNYFIMGNGSNLLASDKGYRGIVVSTRGTGGMVNVMEGMDNRSGNINTAGTAPRFLLYLDEVCIYNKGDKEAAGFFVQNGYSGDIEELQSKNLVYAGSGILLSKLASVIGNNAFEGFAFASGIPGTLGGAVVMNAGAYGGEIKDVIEGVRVLAHDGSIKILKKNELGLAYRDSIIQQEHMVVLDALFAFGSGNKEQILANMKELDDRRRSRQPLEHGSAGSTFKRPEGYFAGKLIEDAGLKGYRCGDVMVSEKHSGFVVNVGKGTFGQAMDVINHVKAEVKKNSGVDMELEVKILQ